MRTGRRRRRRRDPRTAASTPHARHGAAGAATGRGRFAHRLKDGHPFGRLTIGRHRPEGGGRAGNGLAARSQPGARATTRTPTSPGRARRSRSPATARPSAPGSGTSTRIRNGDYDHAADAVRDLPLPRAVPRVVQNTDWSIIRPQGYERLVLSACHPLYSARRTAGSCSPGACPRRLKGGLSRRNQPAMTPATAADVRDRIAAGRSDLVAATTRLVEIATENPPAAAYLECVSALVDLVEDAGSSPR